MASGTAATRGQEARMAHALTCGLDVGIYERLATRDAIRELTTLAASSGLASLWVAAHVIFPVTLTSPPVGAGPGAGGDGNHHRR